MKFSQVQDAEYLLTHRLKFNKKLVVKFDGALAIAKFVEKDYDKNRYKAVKAIFNDYLDSLIHDGGRQYWVEDEAQSLIAIRKLVEKTEVLEATGVLRDICFLNSNKSIDVFLINPETNFEIVGLSD